MNLFINFCIQWPPLILWLTCSFFVVEVLVLLICSDLLACSARSQMIYCLWSWGDWSSLIKKWSVTNASHKIQQLGESRFDSRPSQNIFRVVQHKNWIACCQKNMTKYGTISMCLLCDILMRQHYKVVIVS